MPELPEVEVVRAGLASAITGAHVAAVEVRDARALKRHLPVSHLSADAGYRVSGHGQRLTPTEAAERSVDFERRIVGAALHAPARRGKFLWVPMTLANQSHAAALTNEPATFALLAHLGMSGQLLLRSHEAPDDRHVRIRMWIEHPQHGDLRVDFADQRLFGSLAVDALVQDPWVPGSHRTVPSQATHIAADPLEKHFDDAGFVRQLRTRNSSVKSAILDQRLISGVGNIYADEALWRVRLHPETPGVAVSARKAIALLNELRTVFARALAEGGTSFDAQYVNVNGQAGYFDTLLRSYGRTGEPCYRCGTAIKKIPFAGRHSHFCPRCQRKRG